jgi:hypothetical protein
MQQAIQISAKLYECRDSARFLFGDDYAERMTEYGQVIRAVADKENIGHIQAAMKIADRPDISGVTMMCVFAALVEMTEPSI